MAGPVERFSLTFMTNLILLHFPASELENALRVSWRESNWNTFAHNPDSSTEDDSYGLFQINMYGYLGPARRRQYKLFSNLQLYDPNINTAVARQIWEENGRSWNGMQAWKNVPATRNYPSSGGTNNYAGGSGGSGSTMTDAEIEQVYDILGSNFESMPNVFKFETVTAFINTANSGNWAESRWKDDVPTAAEIALVRRYAASFYSIENVGENDIQIIDGVTVPVPDSIPGAGMFEALQNFFRILTNPEFWKRVGLGVLGAAVILAGIVLFTKENIKK